jgi:hypothetical protein
MTKLLTGVIVGLLYGCLIMVLNAKPKSTWIARAWVRGIS